MRAILVFLVFLTYLSSAKALVPLESIVLGDISKNYSQEQYSDPLDYLFVLKSDTQKRVDSDFKEAIAIYRGFYEEGRNLEKYCREGASVRYQEKWQREQTKLSMGATLQYIGLDITTRAIERYTSQLGYDEQEYTNLVSNLVGNYCSPNTSVISIKNLKSYFLNLRESSNKFKLPGLNSSPLFSSKLNNLKAKNQIEELELKATIKLFTAFCSWGTGLDNYRLMTPLIRNPIIASFLIRQMAGQELGFDFELGRIFLKPSKKTVRVSCQGLICRRKNSDDFKDEAVLGIGLESYSNDLKRLYCQDIRDKSLQYTIENDQMKKYYNEMTLDLQNLMVGQMTALLTGVPEFSFRIDEFTDYIKLAKLGLDLRWENWANDQKSKNKKDIYYEEPLSIEVVDRELYFEPLRKNFKVVLDINLGEFDRTNQMVGKLAVKFNLKLRKSFLSYLQRELLFEDPYDKNNEKKVFKKAVKMIEEQIFKTQKKLAVAPWAKGLPRLVMGELFHQLKHYDNYLYTSSDEGSIDVPIVMNYAPFALKYLHQLHRAKNTNL